MKSAKYQLPKKLSQILTRKGLTLDEFLSRLGTNLQDWCDAESVVADVELVVPVKHDEILEILKEDVGEETPTIEQVVSDIAQPTKRKKREE